MTILKAQFIKGRPFSTDLSPKVGTVIARLFRIDSPNDEIRQIKSVKAPIGPDGSVEIELTPTQSNEAYEIALAPKSNARSRFVKIPDQITIDWEDLVDVNPNTFAPYASGESSGGGGLKQYANPAELAAVKSAEIGVLTVDDTLAAYPELTGYVGNGGSTMVVITTIHDMPMDEDDAPGIGMYRFAVQTAVLAHPNAGNTYLTLNRKAYYDGDAGELLMAYENWTVSVNVRPNTTSQQSVAFFLSSSQGGGLGVLSTPSEGTYTLKVIDGAIQFVADTP